MCQEADAVSTCGDKQADFFSFSFFPAGKSCWRDGTFSPRVVFRVISDMEVKSSSRVLKRSAHGGPGTAGDRRKAKPKKKKDKRKPSLKGTESTDVPSPELDSEVPLDGDVTLTDQGGQCLSLFHSMIVRV